MVKYNKRLETQGLYHIPAEILVMQCGEMENKIDRTR